MSKQKFFDLPIEQKIPLTKESIKKELENEGGYPKHVRMNSNYMLEIFGYVERLEHENERLRLQIGRNVT